ncbi:MAG: sortase [Candidatus Limnocylindrales bacterium]
MGFIADLLRFRVLPALVAALGVSFIAAGLLTYTTGTDLDLVPPPSGIAVATERPFPTPIGGPTDAPTGRPSPTPRPTVAPPTTAPIPTSIGTINILPSPLTSGPPTPKPTAKPTAAPTAAQANRTATRVVIPALEIDLAVVRPPGGPSAYPLCKVAMYLQNLHQPGQPGATYLYAHAREGMFLPLLDQSKINNGRAMIGMLVQVYTSDNRYYLYQITEVRRHQLTLSDAINAKEEELWLQTSEGPKGTPGKLQVVAVPLSNGPAEQKDAHPVAKPLVCD